VVDYEAAPLRGSVFMAAGGRKSKAFRIDSWQGRGDRECKSSYGRARQNPISDAMAAHFAKPVLT
jgi:hypothetical protein